MAFARRDAPGAPAQRLSFKQMGEGGSPDAVVPLVENEDYYFENGLMVFTARYHLRRGYCCEQGCRHCPYAEAPKRNSKEGFDGNQETK